MCHISLAWEGADQLLGFTFCTVHIQKNKFVFLPGTKMWEIRVIIQGDDL